MYFWPIFWIVLVFVYLIIAGACMFIISSFDNYANNTPPEKTDLDVAAHNILQTVACLLWLPILICALVADAIDAIQTLIAKKSTSLPIK
jgi:hypothetical protein